MPTIQTKDSDGSVVIYGNPTCPPAAKAGFTVRTVDALPNGPGTLLWQADKLVRVPQIPPVPKVVTPAQLREWLIRNGKLDAVTAALAAIPDATERAVMQSWFEYASEVRRDNPKVLTLAQTLGMTSDQIDAAFRAAALL